MNGGSAQHPNADFFASLLDPSGLQQSQTLVNSIKNGGFNMNSGGSAAPPPPDYAALTTQELQTNTGLAPQLLAAQQTFGPQFAGTGVSNLQATLFGTPAGPPQTQGYVDAVTGQFVPAGSITPYQAQQQTGPYGQNTPLYIPATQPGGPPGSGTPAQPGILSLAPQVQQEANTVAGIAQAGQFQNIANLGPMGVSALQSMDPAQAQLQASLMSNAQQGVNAGTSLTPVQQRQIDQSVAGAQAARGGGFGPADVYANALGVSQYGQQLQQQRLQNAQAAGASQYQYYGGPAYSILSGMPNNGAQGYNQQAYGISSPLSSLFGSTFNASNVANTAYNAQNAQYLSGQNNNAAITGAGISGGAAIGGAALLALL